MSLVVNRDPTLNEVKTIFIEHDLHYCKVKLLSLRIIVLDTLPVKGSLKYLKLLSFVLVLLVFASVKYLFTVLSINLLGYELLFSMFLMLLKSIPHLSYLFCKLYQLNSLLSRVYMQKM